MSHCCRALGHGGFGFAPASLALRRTPASLQPRSRSLGRAVLASRWESRRFASSFFRVKASEKGSHEHAFFVIGIDRNRFFGQDASEEGLKLLERLVEQDPHYHLLFGVSDEALSSIQKEHSPTNRRLTPSGELGKVVNGELVPLVQAGIIDGRPRTAVGRKFSCTCTRACWEILLRPREAVHLYWAIWHRNAHPNAEGREFWLRYFPATADVYFNESAEWIAIRSVDYLVNRYSTGKSGSTVLFVNNDLFAPCVKHLEKYLSGGLPRLDDERLWRELQARIDVIRTEYLPHYPVVFIVYFLLPSWILVNIFCQFYIQWFHRRVIDVDDRE